MKSTGWLDSWNVVILERGITDRPECATAHRRITTMPLPEPGERRIAASDADLLDAVLAFIEERIDDDNEQTRIDTVASLPLAQRRLP